MYGSMPTAAHRLAQLPQQLADGGLVARMKSADAGPSAYGARGLSQLRDMIPKVEAMGYQQAAPAPAPVAAPAPVLNPRAAQLMAMIPQMEAMGFRQQPQRLADGGIVGTARRLMGLGPSDPAQAAALAEYKANAEREKAAARAAQAPASAPAPAISDYSGMGAMQRREKAQGLAEGGMVRGPGTGTSDSIPDEAEPGTFIMPADSTEAIGPSALEKMGTMPVRLSDGEFKLPPEQVMNLGVAVLKLLKDATHTPVNGVDGGQTDAEVDGARGFNPADRMAQMPEQLFADGGMVENDVTRVGNSYSGGNVGGNIGFNGQMGNGTVSTSSWTSPVPTPAPAPAPAATPAQAPAAAPATAAAPAPAAPMGWAERNAQRSLEVTASSIMDSPERRMAQAALAPPPAPVAPVPAPAPTPSATGFQTAQQRMGSLPQPQLGFQPRRYADGGLVEEDERAQRLAQIPTGGPAGWNGGAPAPAVPAPAPASGGGSLTRAAALATPPAPVAPPPAAGFQSASERMASAPQGPGLGFQPEAVTAQSNTAADGLARRGAVDAMAAMPSAPAPVPAPTVRHSGNDWAARNALRSAEVSASSITANGGRFDETGGRNPAALAYQSALATDNALQASEPGLAAAAMKENSETNRATLRERSLAAQALASERGAMDRTLIAERGSNARAGIGAQAATDAARIKAQQDNKAPAGYRFTADGNLQAIPGGPAAAGGKPLTEDQAKSAGYALRMDNALKLIGDVGAKNPGATRPGVLTGVLNTLPEGAANMLRPEDRQRVEAAQLDALDAALTLNTGAAYTREQLQGLSRAYFAQPGDDDSTVADKQNRLGSLIETARVRAGSGGTAMIDAVQSKQAAAPAAQDAPPQIAELQRRAANNPALAARLKEMGY